MKIILVMVTSLDGKSTQAGSEGTHMWNSDEDKRHFQNILDTGNLLIMGSSTYEGAKPTMEHKEGRIRIVLTRNPEKYSKEKIEGKLEFTNEDPKILIKRLESQGLLEGYLLGGANTNTSFFKENLVDEIWQTIEPKILGKGNGILGEEMVDVNLKLLSFEKLNERGTLLLKYQVVKN